MSNFLKNFTDLKVLLILYIVITVIVSVGEIAKGSKEFGGRLYPHYNNYLIFSKSFFHLLKGEDLYSPYPDEHWDLYKYTPTFALLMGFFAIFPEQIGLILWNLVNSMLPFFVIKSLKFSNERKKACILWFILVDVVTSMQNSQSNGLIAGLLILAFVFFEKGKVHLSSLFLTLSLFVKPIGLISFLLFFLYPKKIKFLYSTFIFLIILSLLPLILLPPSQLLSLYKSWINLLMRDYNLYEGLSVFGILKKWFGFEPSKLIILIVGIGIFSLPFFRVKAFENEKFRIFFLCSSLLWSVIFNHKAESPTFIIATSGVALWYFSGGKSKENLILLILYFLFTSISSTDITPPFFKEKFMKPYLIKGFPSIVLWVKIQLDLLFSEFNSEKSNFLPSP